MQYLKEHVTIIAICGLAGSGKDTFARMLESIDISRKKERRSMAVIPSFTTRKMRVGEQNGREHIFLSEMPEYQDNDLFAYARYGDADYWTTEVQLRKWDKNIYVVDEESIKRMEYQELMHKKHKSLYRTQPDGCHDATWDFKLIKIFIMRNTSGDDTEEWRERISRDSNREFDGIKWDFIINNGGTLDELRTKAEELYKKLK